MARDIPIGNGNALIAFDTQGILRELYYPRVGEESHTKGEPFRFGIWVDGRFSWIPDGWEVKRDYLGNSLVTNVEFLSHSLKLKIRVNDCVDFVENIYLRNFHIENLSDQTREVRLFFAHDFHIYGTEIGDTAAFRPENRSLIHYKNDRYFLVNVFANSKYGIDFFATGNKETASSIGTWKDAEDGVLSHNPIAQGSVDSVLAIPLTLKSQGTESGFYWIAMGKNWEEVKGLNELVKKKTPEELFKRTKNYWELWVEKEKIDSSLLSEKILRLYKRSLLICRTQINNCGSIIAANDSDSTYFNRDTYSYMWPRDGALVAYALDLAGYETDHFYLFCGKILEKEGFFLHKYTPTGALGSSWHPWMKGNKAQLPIQEDETALVIWALWNHYKIRKDLELIRPLYAPLIKKAADFMMNYRNPNTGLPCPSFDLWEERQGVLTFTVAAVFGGLMAAANFAESFGETGLAEEYRSGAQKMREAMDQYLYLKNEKRFARMINFNRDEVVEVDSTVDASLYGIFAFGAYEADHPFVESTMEQVYEKLWVKTDGGGLARYENDPYYRVEEGLVGNPWFITTLWMAQYYIAKAKDTKDLEGALKILNWVADHALPSGVLSEQINPLTHQPLSVSPLTWSHGALIATVQQYLQKISLFR